MLINISKVYHETLLRLLLLTLLVVVFVVVVFVASEMRSVIPFDFVASSSLSSSMLTMLMTMLE